MERDIIAAVFNYIIPNMKDRMQERKEKSNTYLKAQLPLDNNEYVNLKASMPINVTLISPHKHPIFPIDSNW